MIQNAKDYNATKSEIFEDAERLRKAMSNFMPKHNPAYADPNYRAYPTAIPQELLDRVSTPVPASVNGNSEKVKLVLTNNRASTGGRRQSRAVSTPQADPRDDMVAAQLKLLDELSDQPDAINFEEKPPKNIPGYYKVIKEPTSISDVRSALDEGQFTGWDDFASAVRLIWSNAKTFNEDASDIYEMADALEQWFDQRVEKAGGPGPRSIKLNISQPAAAPKLILSLGRRGTSAASVGGDDSSSVQKHETADSTRTRPSTVDAGTPVPPNLKRSGSGVGSQSSMQDIRPPLHQATSELAKSQLSMQTTTPAMSQPPAPMTNVLPLGPQIPNLQMPNGTHPTQMVQLPKPVNLFAESDNPIERRYRDPGKGKYSTHCSSRIRLTPSRYKRCHIRQRDLHDASRPPQESEMETRTLRFRHHDPNFKLRLPPIHPLLPPCHTPPDHRMQEPPKTQDHRLSQLGADVSGTRCTRCL